jgi:acetyl esterase
MAAERTPFVHATRAGLRDRVLRRCLAVGVGASLLVSPRPAALLVRRVFASGGAKVAEALEKHAPTGVEAIRDERYGDEPDMLLDVFRPASASEPLPLVLWVHGGGWVGGAKEELSSYLALVASKGFVVAGPRYSLAPEHRYPTPLREIARALDHLQADAERYGIDPARIALAGDSAGAQIAAQVALLATADGYAEAVGVESALAAEQLRGVVLACGPYDLGLARGMSTGASRRLMQIVLWAYSGKRRFEEDAAFANCSITDHVTAAFPPALVTVGNADPLRPHSELLVERLRAQGVDVEALFFPDDHQPPLHHEYQFDLDSAEGRLFLDRLLAFLRRRLA